MRRRLLAVVAGVVTVGVAGPVPVPAVADAPPPIGTSWSACTGATDTYCIASQTRNGLPVAVGDTTVPYIPYVDQLDAGTIRYGVVHNVSGDGGTTDGAVDPADTYSLVVRTGAIVPRELYGNIRNVTFTRGGTTGAWTFTLTFKPTPVHWVGFDDADGGGADPRSCTIAACGDDSWAASLNYDGFVTGYVTDLASSGLSSSEIAWRTGMVRAYNAQDENTFYDPDTNAFVIQLANPHLVGPRSAPGAPATGSYQAFFPDAYLVNVMNVPDPTTVSAGSFSLVRTVGGTTTSVPFTVSRRPGGVEIDIPSITYSRPTYRIQVKPSVPGVPRSVRARKISAHKAKVRFVKPAANGGRRIDWYQARCHKVGKTWHRAKRTVSPITVANLPKGRVWCQVRAHNVKGYGRWSVADRS